MSLTTELERELQHEQDDAVRGFALELADLKENPRDTLNFDFYLSTLEQRLDASEQKIRENASGYLQDDQIADKLRRIERKRAILALFKGGQV